MNEPLKELLKTIIEWCSNSIVTIPIDIVNILKNHRMDFTVADAVADNILPIGISLMVLFFIIEFTSKCINPDWITYQNVTMFILKAMIFKQVITYSSDLLRRVYNVTMNVFLTISDGVDELTPLDADGIITAIEEVDSGIKGFLIILVYFLAIGIMALIVAGSMIYLRVIVYGIFVEILLHKALSPVVLSTLVSESVSSIGKRFLQSYAAVCLQSSIIVLASLIFNSLMSEILGFATDGAWEKLLGFCAVILCYTGTLSRSGSITKSMLGL